MLTNHQTRQNDGPCLVGTSSGSSCMDRLMGRLCELPVIDHVTERNNCWQYSGPILRLPSAD